MYKLIAPAPFGADHESGKSRHMLRSQFEPDECNITSAGSMVNPNIAEGPQNDGPSSAEAGHCPHVSDPEAVADLLDGVASSS